MKEKLLTVLVIIGIGAVALSSALFIARSISSPPVEKIFPRDSLIYLSVSDMLFARENIKTTRLWTALNSAEVKPQFESLKEEFFAKTEERLGFNLKEMVDLMEKQVSFGVLKLPEKDKKPELLFAADVKKTKSKMKDLFEKKIEPALKNKGMEITEVEYEGHPYRLVKKNDEPMFTYGFIGSVLTLANSEEAIRKAIKVEKGDAPSIAKNDSLKAMKARVSYKRGVLAYADLKNLISKLKEKESGKKEEMDRAFALIGLEGLKAGVFCSSIERNGFHDRFFLSVEPKNGGIIGLALSQKPRQPKGINYIPKNISNMGILTFNDPDEIWVEIKEILKNNLSEEEYSKFEQKIAAFEKGFRLDVEEDILAPLGNEIGWAALTPKEMPSPGVKPSLAMISKTPFLVYLGAKDTEKFGKVVEQMTALLSLALQTSSATEDHLGYTITYFTSDLLKSSPGISLVDDFYLVASDKELIKKAIESGKEKKGIQENADYKLVTEGFPKKVNQLSYHDIPGILKNMAALIKEEGIKEEQMKQILTILPAISNQLFGGASYIKVEKGGVYGESFSSTGFFIGIAYFPMMRHKAVGAEPPSVK
jgi:hypothetical protein